MICEDYNQLSHADKIIFIGELLHSVQCDNELFQSAKTIIEIARLNNILTGVIILPQPTTEQ